MDFPAYAPLALVCVFLACGVACFLGPRPSLVRPLVTICGGIAVVLALGTAWVLLERGPLTVNPIGIALMSFRIDQVSVLLLVLAAVLAAVVLRFSAVYLEGESRRGVFLGWMCLTIACVAGLVTAGSLVQLVAAWIGSSLCLQRLLLFYPERPRARQAARKAFITARASDAALIGAAISLWALVGTTDIATLSAAVDGGESAGWGITLAAGLIAVAAMLRSAQFPSHSWLTEVMEAPTPMSALLHAGVINAGGFLLIRFADVLVTAPGVLAALVMIGGFTALFGSMVMLTQSAVKTSLAWSTVAQMGFMIFQCGLALFPLALLHILAHSVYKAHAFLSAGESVARIAAIRRPGPVAVPGPGAVLRAFVTALVIYALVGVSFGLEGKSPQALALGAILIFGVAYLLAQGFADRAPWALTRHTAAYAFLAAVAYFGLQTGMQSLLADTLPAAPDPGGLEWGLIVLALISFGLVAIAQATSPLWCEHPATAGLRVHLANGFYVGALVDRVLRCWAYDDARTPHVDKGAERS